MLQTQEAPKSDSYFPPPASDLATASITRRIAVCDPGQVIVQTLLDDLDLRLSTAAGEPAITKMLKGLGTDKSKAVADFSARNRGQTPVRIFRKVTAIPEERITALCPGIADARDPATVETLTKQLLDGAIADRTSSLRELTIEAVSQVLTQNSHEYESRRAEATKEYETLFTDMCNPGAADIMKYATEGTGKALATATRKTGQALQSAAASAARFFRTLPANAKSGALFLLDSVLTHNLPAIIKSSFGIGKFIGKKDEASYVTSVILSGTANSFLGLYLFFGFPGGFFATSPANACARIVVAAAVGSAIEFLGRTASLFTTQSEVPPGSALLELAYLPFHLLGKGMGKAIKAFRRFEGVLRELKTAKLKEKGL